MARDHRLHHFVIVFDGTAGRVLETRAFDDSDVAAALDVYRDTEARYQDTAGVQVVLISADSLETVQRTHRNYWEACDFRELAMELREGT
jgi:hypothetical protein